MTRKYNIAGALAVVGAYVFGFGTVSMATLTRPDAVEAQAGAPPPVSCLRHTISDNKSAGRIRINVDEVSAWYLEELPHTTDNGPLPQTEFTCQVQVGDEVVFVRPKQHSGTVIVNKAADGNPPVLSTTSVIDTDGQEVVRAYKVEEPGRASISFVRNFTSFRLTVESVD